MEHGGTTSFSDWATITPTDGQLRWWWRWIWFGVEPPAGGGGMVAGGGAGAWLQESPAPSGVSGTANTGGGGGGSGGAGGPVSK